LFRTSTGVAFPVDTGCKFPPPQRIAPPPPPPSRNSNVPASSSSGAAATAQQQQQQRALRADDPQLFGVHVRREAIGRAFGHLRLALQTLEEEFCNF